MALIVNANTGYIRHEGLIPGSGRSLGGGHGKPLQYSCLENPMDVTAGEHPVNRVTCFSDLSGYVVRLPERDKFESGLHMHWLSVFLGKKSTMSYRLGPHFLEVA